MEGIERIKKLAEGQNDKALQKVVQYLIIREDMDHKYLNEEKDLKQMCEFIQEQAKEKTTNAGWNCYEDEEVYSWAIHYYDESDEDLGIVKKKEVPKIEKTEIKTIQQIEKKEVEQITLF